MSNILDEEVERNYVCPCQLYSEDLDFQIIVLDKTCFFKCSICWYPWPTFLPIPLTTCKSCRNATYEIESIVTVNLIITCPFCRGDIPKSGIRNHLRKLIQLHISTDKSNKPAGGGQLCSCKDNTWNYRFENGIFFKLCDKCEKRSLLTNEEDILKHSKEFSNCCDNLLTGISGMKLSDYIITQCTSCLSETVLDNNQMFGKLFSQHNWGSPYSDQRILSIFDLRVGDHIAYIRKLYEHHVIVVWVSRSMGAFKQIGFTQPLKKHEDDNTNIFTGRVELTEKKFLSIKDPLMRINYLPLDCYPIGYVVWRAFDRLHESQYNLLTNNCEHIATWCKYGRNECIQIQRLFTKYSKIGQEIMNEHLVPVVQNLCEQVEKVSKNDQVIPEIQNAVAKQQVNLKGKFKNVLGFFLGERSVSKEEEPKIKHM